MTYYLDDLDNTHNISLIEKAFGEECKVFRGIRELLNQSDPLNVLVLNSDSKDLIRNIKMIRQSQQYFLTPILLDKSIDPMPIVDGTLINPLESKKTINTIQQLSDQLSITQFDWKSKVLYFLFTRPNLSVMPEKDWLNKNYYYYPLLEYFASENTDYWQWLEHIVQQNIFEARQLIDNLFCCFRCHSSHLKMTEICPNCKSYNIQAADFLHCFNCGLIAPQIDFIKSDRLICPKCNNQLKHIGEDYDRSLESGRCLKCKNYYIDSQMQIECMICKENFSTDKLTKMPVSEFVLTEHGKNCIRANSFERFFSLFDKLNSIHPDYFYSTLDWFLAMQQRYPEEIFSLVGISIPFPSSDIAATFLQTFAEQLRLILRTTDFVTRLSNKQHLWILLPKTDKTSLDTPLIRIKSIIHHAPKSLQDSIKLAEFTSSPNHEKEETASLLISRLASSL